MVRLWGRDYLLFSLSLELNLHLSFLKGRIFWCVIRNEEKVHLYTRDGAPGAKGLIEVAFDSVSLPQYATNWETVALEAWSRSRLSTPLSNSGFALPSIQFVSINRLVGFHHVRPDDQPRDFSSFNKTYPRTLSKIHRINTEKCYTLRFNMEKLILSFHEFLFRHLNAIIKN